MNNDKIAANGRPTFSAMLATTGYQKAVMNTLKDPERAKRFCAAITSAVAVNPALQECDPPTILSGALLGESLNLSPSPQLGQYYLVPFWNSKKRCNDAQFILGYKGYIQLALRSGQYKHLSVLAVKQGELVRWDPLTEDAELSMVEDEEAREALPTIGYLAMFEYVNGFRKVLYWSRSKMERHALKYSKGYAAKKGYTFWEKDFDSMAYKTMLRQLISKWGIMSIDMRTAVEKDLEAEAEAVQPDDVIEARPEAAAEIPEKAEEKAPAKPAKKPAEKAEEAPEELTLDDL